MPLLLSVFIAFLGIGIIIPVMPVFATYLGASSFALGMIIAAFSITRGLLLPLVGNLSDKYGGKRFLATGLIIYGAVGLLIPLAVNVEQLIVIRSFHGMGSAMIVPVAMAYLSALSPANSEGRYMSYLNMAIFSGIGCGPILGGIIFDFFDISAVFHLMAILSFFAFILVANYMPAHVQGKKSRARGLLRSLGEMLTSLSCSGILLARFSTMIVMVPTMAFLPLIMSDWPGSSGFQIGTVIAARTLMNAALQVPFGTLTDRSNKLVIFIVASTMIALTVTCIPLISGFTAMILLYMLLGAEEAAVWAVLGGYASIEAKKGFGHGTMMGAFSLAMSLGVFSGAVFSGISMDGWGPVKSFFWTSLLVLLLSIAAAIMLWAANRHNTIQK